MSGLVAEAFRIYGISAYWCGSAGMLVPKLSFNLRDVVTCLVAYVQCVGVWVRQSCRRPCRSACARNEAQNPYFEHLNSK